MHFNSSKEHFSICFSQMYVFFWGSCIQNPYRLFFRCVHIFFFLFLKVLYILKNIALHLYHIYCKHFLVYCLPLHFVIDMLKYRFFLMIFFYVTSLLFLADMVVVFLVMIRQVFPSLTLHRIYLNFLQIILQFCFFTFNFFNPFTIYFKVKHKVRI